MSLFSDLLRLQGGQTSTEDFFTEIVAHLLRETDDLLMDWLSYLQLLDTSEYIDFQVTTQVSYGEGRPDILIELFTDDADDVIFLESKLGAQEGRRQLRRYAKELAKRSHVRKRILLYITRKYDPKDAAPILKDLPQIPFKQQRWHEFYQILKSFTDDSLVEATCRFMEERGMAQTNLFNPTDVLAMSRLPQVLSLMNETLFGEVSQFFEDVVGSVSTERRIRQELRKNRYLLRGSLCKGKNMSCGLGYWFPDTEYPTAGMMLELHPNASQPDPILSMMKELSQESEWGSYNLNKPKNWSKITLRRPLNEFLAGEDHVAEIKVYFHEILNNLVSIKNRYPEVPWKILEQGSEEE